MVFMYCRCLTFFFAFSLSQCYSAHAAYCHSKLAQLLFSSHLHQELQHGHFPVISCAVDPGMVDTALYRHLWTPVRLVQSIIAHLLFKVKWYSVFISFIHTSGWHKPLSMLCSYVKVISKLAAYMICFHGKELLLHSGLKQQTGLQILLKILLYKNKQPKKSRICYCSQRYFLKVL